MWWRTTKKTRMIEQKMYERNYRWHVTIFYDVTPKWEGVITEALAEAGISPTNYFSAAHLIHSGHRNEGFTYTNPSRRVSVMMIGRVTDMTQFVNTLTHEVDHLADHICEYYGIPLGSEDNAYLHGDLMAQICSEAADELGGFFKAAWERLQYVL